MGFQKSYFIMSVVLNWGLISVSVILAESRAFLCCDVRVLLGKPKAALIIVTSVTFFIAEVCYSVGSNVYGICPWIVIVAPIGKNGSSSTIIVLTICLCLHVVFQCVYQARRKRR